MKQITKEQHYVPKFYLKRFAREGQIQVLNVKAKQIGKPRLYGSVCYEKFFYAAETGVKDEISQAFEDVFGQIETLIGNNLPGIIERAVAQQLTNDDLDVLAYFMSVQWLRTRSFRDWLYKMRSEMMKWFLKQQVSLRGFQDDIQETADTHKVDEHELNEAVNRLIESGEYDFREINNASHLNFIDEDKVNGFSNLLLAKKWRIILSEEPYHFITSDNPVAAWIPPRTGLIPVTFIDQRHLLALTPNILIETGRPDTMNPEQQPVDRPSYHTVNEKGILMFNKVLASHAHEYAYAHQKDELEQLLKAI